MSCDCDECLERRGVPDFLKIVNENAQKYVYMGIKDDVVLGLLQDMFISGMHYAVDELGGNPVSVKYKTNEIKGE